MAKIGIKVAAIAVIAAAFVAACGKMEDSSYYGDEILKNAVREVKPNLEDRLVDEVPIAEVELVGDSLVFIVTTTLVYVTPENENKEIKNTTEVFKLLAIEGVDDQYFDYTDNYTTTRGDARYVEGTEYRTGNFYVTPRDSVNMWNASNGTHTFIHSTTTHFPKVMWVSFNEELDRDIECPIDIKPTAPKEQTTHEGETGVSFNGKVWDAVKYSSSVSTSYEGVKGSVSATNVAYLLKHEVSTEVENLDFQANFKEAGNKVVTDKEFVDFALVTRDNGEIVENVPHHLDMNLFTVLSNVEDVEVYSEAALLKEEVSYNRGTLAETASVSGMFEKTTSTFTDQAVMTDGRVVNVDGGYERWNWGSYAFPYAYILSREAKVSATANETLSTAFKKVADVTVMETIVIRYFGVSRADETKRASVSYKRFYNVPDNYTTQYESQEYVGKFSATEGTFATDDQHNAYVRRTYNNGVLTEEKAFELPLVLAANMTRTSESRVSVDEVKNLTVTMGPNGGDKTTFGEPDENGYRAQRITKNYTLRVSDGSLYNLEVITENTVKNGEEVFDYAWFDAIEPEVSLQPKLNAAESTAENPVYDVTIAVNLNVARTTRGQVQTRGTSAEKEPYTITASHQEEMTVEDELVSARQEKTVTPKANGFDVKVRFFETYSLSGEKMVSEQTGEMVFDIKGSNGNAITVDNVNFNTTGNGHNGTGNGTYTDNASNGKQNFNNSYSYSADNSKSFSYNGKTVTFTASFKIVEAGQNIGSKTAGSNYDAYPYTNTVKGIYTVEGQNVEKTATATKELRIERQVETLVGNLVAAGMSVVPAHAVGAGFADGSGRQEAHKCLTLVKADGSATAIVFAHENGEVIPTDGQIKAGQWVAGSYNASYNSGVYMNGQWVPAVAQDNSWGISYSIPTQSNIRSIRNETLKQWGWRNGYFSTKLPDYNVTVVDGVCTIYYNGEVVKQFR